MKLPATDDEAILLYRNMKLRDVPRADLDDYLQAQYDLGKRHHEKYHCLVYISNRPILDRFLSEYGASAVYTIGFDNRSEYEQYILIKKNSREEDFEEESSKIHIYPGMETNVSFRLSLVEQFKRKN